MIVTIEGNCLAAGCTAWVSSFTGYCGVHEREIVREHAVLRDRAEQAEADLQAIVDMFDPLKARAKGALPLMVARGVKQANADLRARVQAGLDRLVALKRYVRHADGCQSWPMSSYDSVDHVACTCGLSALLTPLAAPAVVPSGG